MHDAEDVFQEVFARAYQHLDELRDDAAVRAWIGTLTRGASASTGYGERGRGGSR